MYSAVIQKLLCLRVVFRYLFSLHELNQARPASVMLICHDADRGFIWQGKRYAQLLDSINDRLIALGIDTISVSAPFSRKSDNNYRNPINVNGLIARALLWSKIDAILPLRNTHKNPKIRAWDSLLNYIKPRLIIGIQPSAELCIAAKVKGIWVADLQHGILSGENYYSLSYRKSFDQSGWPSCILCWNDESLTWVKNNIGIHTRALVIGNPWIIRFINQSKTDRLVSSMLTHSISDSAGRLKVLITSQWGPYFKQYNSTGLPAGLISAIKHLDKHVDWWIRIHPVMLNNIGRDRLFRVLEKEFSHSSNVYWEHPTVLPLPQILNYVDLHVTLSSAVTIEARWFGIPTALLGDNVSDLNKWFGAEIKDGYAEIIKAEHQYIVQWIYRRAKSRSTQSPVVTIKAAALDGFVKTVNVCVNSQECIEDLLECN